jgi:putative sigma-54 modulation protein
MRSAQWLIRSIQQRQRTILKVTRSILKFQREFFERGAQHLRPLILKDVAEDIEMHESTVSRRDDQQVSSTRRREFLSSSTSSTPASAGTTGDDLASEAVKTRIKKLIDAEDTAAIRTAIRSSSSCCEQEGIDIARRTVAKYREQLGCACRVRSAASCSEASPPRPRRCRAQHDADPLRVSPDGVLQRPARLRRGAAGEDQALLRRPAADQLHVQRRQDHAHRASFDVTLRNGLQLHASEATENMYSSVDMALAKMERQVRRYKARIKHHKANEGRTAKVKLGVIAAESVTDAHASRRTTARSPRPPVNAAAQSGEQRAAARRPPPHIIRETEFHAERMTVDAAIMQMNLLHKQFYVFTNANSGDINVVYVLEDGNFGLIEPQHDAAS